MSKRQGLPNFKSRNLFVRYLLLLNCSWETGKGIVVALETELYWTLAKLLFFSAYLKTAYIEQKN